MARLPVTVTCWDRPVTHVTLYRDRADVSRHLTGIAVDAHGPTVIQLKGVPKAVDLNSVRVEVIQQPGQQQYIIGDVSLALLPSDPLPPTPPSAFDLELARKRSQMATLHAQWTELQAKLDVVLYLISMSQEYATTQTKLKSNALDPVVGFLGGFMPGYERTLRELARKKVKLEADVKDVLEQVPELKAWFTRTGTSVSEDLPNARSNDAEAEKVKTIVVTVEPVTGREGQQDGDKSERLTDITLNVSYMIDNASWTPSYDLHVDAKPNSNSIAYLQYHAVVKQCTGEDWLDSRITLSTASGALRSQLQRTPPKFTRRWELNVKQQPPAFGSNNKFGSDGGGFGAFASQSTAVFRAPPTFGGSFSATGASTAAFDGQAFGSSSSSTGGFGAASWAAVDAARSQAPLAASATVSTAPAFNPPVPSTSTPTATVTTTKECEQKQDANSDSPAVKPASHATHFAATYLLPLHTTIRSDPHTAHRLLIASICNMPVTLSHSISANSFKPTGLVAPTFQTDSYSVECAAFATLHAHLVNKSEFTLVPTSSPMRILLNGSPLASDPADIAFGRLKDAATPNAQFSLDLGLDRSVAVVRKPRVSRQVLPLAPAGSAFSRMLAGGAGSDADDQVAKRLGADEVGTLRSARYVVSNKDKSGKGSLVRVKFDESIPVAKKAQNRVEVILPSEDEIQMLENEGAAENEAESKDGVVARVYKQEGVVKFAVPVRSGETREVVYEYLVVRGKD